MRVLILAAGAALTLAACGGNNDSEANDINMMATDNMTMDANAMMANDMGGMDANAATNAATENMMMNDLTNNTADTNLANGL